MKKFAGPLSRRYGVALFSSLLDKKMEDKAIEDFVKEVRFLLSFWNKDLVTLFTNPLISAGSKKKFLEDLKDLFPSKKNLSAELVDFVQLLIANNRINYLASILNYFLFLAEEHLNVCHATITTPALLNGNELKEFQTILESSLKKIVTLKNDVDPSLLSGYVVKIENTLIDASLKLKLSKLKNFMFS